MVARLAILLLVIQALVAVTIGMALHGYLGMAGWLAAGSGVSSVLLVRATIVANNFRLAARFAGSIPPPPLGGRRRLGMILRELRATLRSSSWDMPLHRPAGVRRHAGTATPVLLIHGYGCNGGYWRAARGALDRERISHHALDLEPILASIDAYVPQVDAAIDALCAATGHYQVIVVGHSMGGLVARAWVRACGGARLARLITLGTPHHGTVLAHFGPGENSRQMCRNRQAHDGDHRGLASACSSWLNALNAAQADTGPSRVSIFSHHDNIIVPASSAIVDGAINIGFTGVGHVALGSDRAVLACLIAQIRQEPGIGKIRRKTSMNNLGIRPGFDQK